IQFLQPRAHSQGEGSLVNGFTKTLEALMAWQQGKPAKALAALEQGQIRYNPVIEFIFPEQALARYLRAELLAEMGHYQEALRWYAALVDGADFTAPIRYLGPTYVRCAGIYEKLGNTDKAIEFYGRFVELWQDCDTELRPMVKDARQKLKHLLEQKVKEPEEKQKQIQSTVTDKK
ncbi:MAG: tol-pal system YbgF family protein, partial [bacterium]